MLCCFVVGRALTNFTERDVLKPAVTAKLDEYERFSSLSPSTQPSSFRIPIPSIPRTPASAKFARSIMGKRFEAARTELLQQQLAAEKDAHTINAFFSSIAADPINMIPLFLLDLQNSINLGFQLIRDAPLDQRAKLKENLEIELKLRRSALKYFATLGLDWTEYEKNLKENT